ADDVAARAAREVEERADVAPHLQETGAGPAAEPPQPVRLRFETGKRLVPQPRRGPRRVRSTPIRLLDVRRHVTSVAEDGSTPVAALDVRRLVEHDLVEPAARGREVRRDVLGGQQEPHVASPAELTAEPPLRGTRRHTNASIE